MSPNPLAAARADRLRRGINLSHWFSQLYHGPGYVPAHFDSYIRVADIALIRDMGFDHVRFPINCEPILAATSPDGPLPLDYLTRIRARIAEMHDHGLAVIVDIHPEDPFKHNLARSDDAVATFVAFWKKLASSLSDLDPESTFFEVLNEPCIHNPARWHLIQNRTVATIRSAAPRHTIIITGDQWSLLPDLLALEPPADRNLIANFHLYDPHAFTHQGAGWIGHWAMSTKGLTYPGSPGNVATLSRDLVDSDARDKLAEYLETNWNADAYQRFLLPAVEWARIHGLWLTCNEFGVYKKFSPRSSRLAWIRDVSSALTTAGIGWTMWDYAGDFAVTIKENDIRIPDHELVAALSLPYDHLHS
ncbi:MAG: cellulase family glycosylhydrolase [Opitutaceae bacterium]|jgi:aryl-phospho-beta-D-glucosidase BglC (GH1 family)